MPIKITAEMADRAWMAFDKERRMQDALAAAAPFIAAAEREVCAKIVESFAPGGVNYDYDHVDLDEIAETIRARKN
jgi:hypothetical protein